MLKQIVSNLKEAYEEPGKRDMTGPYKGSRQRRFGKGKRKMSGEKCPMGESSYDVVWTDRNYKSFKKSFKDDPDGAPENGLVKAKKFAEKLNNEDKKDNYGLYRSVSVLLVDRGE